MTKRIAIGGLFLVFGCVAQAQSNLATCDEARLRSMIVEIAKDCPNQTLQLKIGYNPGGNTYTLATHFMTYLKRIAGTGEFSVVLDAKAGASGEIASRLVAEMDRRAASCNLLVAQSNQLTTNSMGVPNAVDPNVDLVPIAPLGESPLVLAVNPKTAPYLTLPDWITYLKNANGPHRQDFFGSNGNYATDHLATERLLLSLGVAGTHVPFTGSAPLILNLMTTTDGQVNFALLSLGLIKDHLVSGNLLGLGIAAPDDLAIPRAGHEDLVIPSISRAVPGYSDAAIWVALAGGRNMPPALNRPMQNLAACFAQDSQVRSVLVEQMYFKLGGTRDQMLQRMRDETKMAHAVYKK